MTEDVKLITDINKMVQIMNAIEESISTNSNRLSQIDCELSDWLHLLQNEDLTDSQCINIAKKIKELRKKRNAIKNEHEILEVYKTNKNKLISNQRDYFCKMISEKIKTLNQPYKNRIITDEKIEAILNSGKRKRGRPKKDDKRQ